MNVYLTKFVIFALAIFACAFLFVAVGNEIFIQLVMLYEDVPERTMLPRESGIIQIGVFLLIPEVIFGSIGGWYLAEWLSKKMYKD